MKQDRVRLGGMALENGVLVHGPTSWAVAVRGDEGELKVASGAKKLRAAEVRNPFLRGPARLAELFAVLPAIRKALPEAKLPYQRFDVAAALAGSAFLVRGLRGTRVNPVVREAFAALASVGPAVLAVRGTKLAEYHGAEHISIGTYEHGEPRQREHERCGSHLVGPLLVTTTLGGLAARLAPPRARFPARAGAAVGAMAASVELFSWMVRNERHPLARALAKPGHELQHRFLTAEPTPEQLEVANAALAECLRLEAEFSTSPLESAANGHDRDPTEEAAPPT